MLVNTKYFGEIDITDDKIVTFEQGIFGFENFKKYTILYDVDSQEENVISWLQSVEEPGLALPIINPLVVKEDYNPSIEDELLSAIGELKEDNMAVFLVMTVPSDITKMTANLKAPLIINADTKKGVQLIVENADYVVKYNIYNVFEKNKEGVETC